MAEAKVRAYPTILRRALLNAWVRRWTGMISYAVQDAYAASILEEHPAATLATDGMEPSIGLVAAHDASEMPGVAGVGELLTSTN